MWDQLKEATDCYGSLEGHLSDELSEERRKRAAAERDRDCAKGEAAKLRDQIKALRSQQPINVHQANVAENL